MHTILCRRTALRQLLLTTRMVVKNRGSKGIVTSGEAYAEICHSASRSVASNIHKPVDLDADMPPDYELESFWDSRFKTERHFEWLGDGQDTIIPVLRSFFESWRREQRTNLPRVLHIGAGTSRLSDGMVRLYQDVFQSKEDLKTVVVNTDFAEQAVERGKQSEGTTKGEVKWERVDLLNWQEVQAFRRGLVEETGSEDGGIFNFVVDKSTSDAISCGAGLSFGKETLTDLHGQETKPLIHPLISSCASRGLNRVLTLEPLDVLALHLASLVRPGGLWVALSYSSHRFPSLVSQEDRRLGAQHLLDVTRYWAVDVVKEVDTPSGWGKQGNSFAPDIKHHLYIFRRTNMTLEP